MIVETGAGIANADSYGTLIEAAAYHTKFNNLDWTGVDVDLEQALKQGTRSVELLYSDKFNSLKLMNLSPLSFPRYAFYDTQSNYIASNVIPVRLKEAVFEIALKFLVGEDVYPTNNNSASLDESIIKVDTIEITNHYNRIQKSEQFNGFLKIERILSTLFKNVNTTLLLRR